VLAVTELRVVLGERDVLGVEGRDQRVDRRGGSGHPGRREAQGGVEWDRTPVVEPGQGELVLDRGPELQAALGEPGHHPVEELTRAGVVRDAVETHVIDEHRRRPRRVRQHRERRRVGHEPDLAHRAHALDRLQLVERVHRLHRHGQPDAGPHPLGQVLHGDDLAPHHPAVVAVEEPHEPYSGVAAPGNHILG
jgi:hypothetical protein